jgi:hypothetical protein
MVKGDAELETLDRDGYVVVNNLLDRDKVALARRRFEELFQLDLDARRQQSFHAQNITGPAGETILTGAAHFLVNVYGKNRVFDELVDQALGDPRITKLIEAWSGPGYKITGYNVRYMTGAYDPPPALELHRDGQGAMNLCVMLSDVEPGDNAATSFVPGSHRFPSCPRWDHLLSAPFRLRKDPSRTGLSLFLRWNLFNRLLKWRLPRTTGAFGKSGAVYFMPNGEVWHGRLPNVHGKRTMICLMGVYASDAQDVANPPALSDEVRAKLPPRLAKALAGPFTVNDPTGSMFEALLKTRRGASVFSLFYWARLERRVCEWLSNQWLRKKEFARRVRLGVARRAKGLFSRLARAR